MPTWGSEAAEDAPLSRALASRRMGHGSAPAGLSLAGAAAW